MLLSHNPLFNPQSLVTLFSRRAAETAQDDAKKRLSESMAKIKKQLAKVMCVTCCVLMVVPDWVVPGGFEKLRIGIR
jgi:hypothetical protein